MCCITCRPQPVTCVIQSKRPSVGDHLTQTITNKHEGRNAISRRGRGANHRFLPSSPPRGRRTETAGRRSRGTKDPIKRLANERCNFCPPADPDSELGSKVFGGDASISSGINLHSFPPARLYHFFAAGELLFLPATIHLSRLSFPRI